MDQAQSRYESSSANRVGAHERQKQRQIYLATLKIDELSNIHESRGLASGKRKLHRRSDYQSALTTTGQRWGV
jgi:hypothetical protein